mgnify:CR=1 FL=1
MQELSWLLTRDYSIKGAVKLVGDRHGLTDRQRLSLARAACSDQSKQLRARTEIDLKELPDAHVIIDGFNLIITIEAALSGEFFCVVVTVAFATCPAFTARIAR